MGTVSHFADRGSPEDKARYARANAWGEHVFSRVFPHITSPGRTYQSKNGTEADLARGVDYVLDNGTLISARATVATQSMFRVITLRCLAGGKTEFAKRLEQFAPGGALFNKRGSYFTVHSWTAHKGHGTPVYSTAVVRTYDLVRFIADGGECRVCENTEDKNGFITVRVDDLVAAGVKVLEVEHSPVPRTLPDVAVSPTAVELFRCSLAQQKAGLL